MQDVMQKPEMQEADLVAQVNSLLSGEDVREDESEGTGQEAGPVEGDNAAEGEGDQGSKPGPIESLKAVAERLGITPDQLYSIKVGMPDEAEPLTLGQLKDLAQNRHELTTRENTLAEQELKTRRDTMQTRQEIAQLISQVPKQYLTPELVQKARQEWQTYTQKEYTLARDTIPGYDNVLPELVSLVGEFGISEAEFDAVPDHRFRAILDELRTYRKRYAEADAKAKEIKPDVKALKPKRQGAEPAQLRQARRIRQANTEDKKVDAIAQLLAKG